jgi:hypothetical protein
MEHVYGSIFWLLVGTANGLFVAEWLRKRAHGKRG